MFKHKCKIGYLHGPCVSQPRLVTENEYTDFNKSYQPRTQDKGNGQLYVAWFLERFNYCPICGKELICEDAR